MSKVKEMLTEVENRLGSILNGVVVNEKGYLEYREKAPRYSKWSFSYRERLEKEILKHYINRDEAETKEFEVRNEAYEDGFESANIVGKTIPISEVEEDLDYIFQNDEENTTYRRLKEKYKTNKEEVAE